MLGGYCMNRMLAAFLALSMAFAAAAAPPPQARDDDDEARAVAPPDAAAREQLPGAAVYRDHCQRCKGGPAAKAPNRVFVQLMTPEAIHLALTDGIMKTQAEPLSAADKLAVAEYLSGTPVGAPEGNFDAS